MRLKPLFHDGAQGIVADQKLQIAENLEAPLPVGTPVFPSQVVVLYVTVEDQNKWVPNVEGLPIKKAKEQIEAAGFVYHEKIHDPTNFTPDMLKAMNGIVLDQEPESKKRVAAKSTVTVQYVSTDHEQNFVADSAPVASASGGGKTGKGGSD